MIKHFDTVIDANGDVVPGATVTVTNGNGDAVQLYRDAAGTQPVGSPINVVTTDSLGLYSFYVSAGLYTISQRFGAGIAVTITDVPIGISAVRSDSPSAEFTFPYGAAQSLAGSTYITTFPSSGVKPVFGSYQDYTITAGSSVTPYQVGEFVGIKASGAGAGGAFYAVNFLAQLDQDAGNLPFTSSELNVNNNRANAYYNGSQGPLFGSVNPWSTGVNIIGGGNFTMSAGLAIGGAGPNAEIQFHRGLSIENGVTQQSISLLDSATTAIYIAGARAGAVLDMGAVSTIGAIGLLLRNQMSVSFRDAGNVIRNVLTTDTSGNILCGYAGKVTAVSGALQVAQSVKLLGLPTYATNAAAVSGGLGVNDVYKTATGELRIVV